jgi:hypothetical protein
VTLTSSSSASLGNIASFSEARGFGVTGLAVLETALDACLQ